MQYNAREPLHEVNTMTRYIYKPAQETVELERWRWEAHYIDGTVIKQFDKIDEDSGEFHRFEEIDQSKLRAFNMVNGRGGKFTLVFDPNIMKLIHRYIIRGMQQQEVDREGVVVNKGEPIKRKFYLFGYETANEKHLMIITPDDSLVVTDDMNKISLMIPTSEIE